VVPMTAADEVLLLHRYDEAHRRHSFGVFAATATRSIAALGFSAKRSTH
jgi:hypothetical protein